MTAELALGALPIVAVHTAFTPMKTTAQDIRPEPREGDIQRAAYFLWLELGRPVGRDVQTWLEAKERLRHRVTIGAEHSRLTTKIRPPRRQDFKRN